MNKLNQKIVASCGIATILFSSSISLANQQNISQSSQSTYTTSIELQQTNTEGELNTNSDPNPTKNPLVETKTEIKTRELPFDTKYVDSNTLAKGTTKVTQTGVNGIETTTYTVTYTDGVETSKEVTKVEVTKKPIDQIITRGTYVAPKPAVTQNCANGTYVNSAGNTICRPVQSSAPPAGATAKCKDGTYSYSQSRRGTCSHHGGVAQWL